MAASVTILAIVIALHLLAFVFAIGAERRRSTVALPPSIFLSPPCSFCFWKFNDIVFFFFVKAEVVPDQYDERTFCKYGTDASSLYGLAAFVLLLISHLVVNGVTKCLCFGKGLVGGSTTCAIFFFIFSWSVFYLVVFSSSIIIVSNFDGC